MSLIRRNCSDLIAEDEKPPAEGLHTEEDQTYAKASLGAMTVEGPGITKVLGVQWNVLSDELQFDIGEVTQTMKDLEPTKRNLVSFTAKFFDPLDVMSPVTIFFKVGWDDPLLDQLQEKWSQLFVSFKPLLPRMQDWLDSVMPQPKHTQQLCTSDLICVDVKFLAAKTRVTSVLGVTIPRLELLSSLLLSKLLTGIQAALQLELSLDDPMCFTDSKASLYRIKGVQHEWKQFVENRLIAIRSLLSPDHWRHCPGRENPADIPSRGMSASALSESSVWLSGPDWLWHKSSTEEVEEGPTVPGVPQECQKEMKRKDIIDSTVAVNTTELSTDLSQVVSPERYSSSHRLLRVTILRFVRRLG